MVSGKPPSPENWARQWVSPIMFVKLSLEKKNQLVSLVLRTATLILNDRTTIHQLRKNV